MFDDDEEDDTGTVFRDVITLALAGFVAAVILLLPHIRPPAKAEAKSAEPPGNVIFEVRWADELDTDVDIWIMAPNGERVGYSAKSSPLLNLLRDDIGHTLDVSGLNYEVAYSRGVMPGEYVVNLHLYRNLSRVLPITATVVASVKTDPGRSAVQLVTATVNLNREGEEQTCFRFRLTADGRLVPGSVNRVYRPVRAA